MPWVKILNRKTNAFTNKEKVHGLSLEFILITFFIAIVLFLLVVSIKQPLQKNRSGVKAPMQQPGEGNQRSSDLQPAHSIKLKG